jgi:hypothetical protein
MFAEGDRSIVIAKTNTSAMYGMHLPSLFIITIHGECHARDDAVAKSVPRLTKLIEPTAQGLSSPSSSRKLIMI